MIYRSVLILGIFALIFGWTTGTPGAAETPGAKVPSGINDNSGAAYTFTEVKIQGDDG